MKKSIFIMIFLMSILSVFIPVSVNAAETINGIYISDDFYFPLETDYLCTTTDTCLKQKIESEYNGSYHIQCWYSSGAAENRSSDIYCYVGNSGFVPYLSYNYGSYINANYNPDGFTISGQPWINSSNHNSYASYAVYKWDSVNYTWSTICHNWSNTCVYNMVYNTPFPTFFYSSISGDTMTPIFKTDIWYTSDRWNAPFIQGLDLKPRPVSTCLKRFEIHNIASRGSAYDLLDTYVYTRCDDLIGTPAGTLYYSYDNSNWYNVGEKEWGDNFQLYVYSNEIVYFKLVDSNNNIILSDSFEVTGKVTFNGYQVINIPSGNHNIYISNFSNSSGSFYIPPDYKVFTDEFVYLDSSGNKVGYQYINTSNYDDIGVDTISGDSYFMLKVPYDYSSFSNVNTLMFNVDSQYDLTLYIPTGLYIDFVDINNKNNYECDSSSDISNGTDLSSCELEYNQIVNNSLVSGTDSTTTKYIEENTNINDSNNFSITFKNMFLQFSKPFYVIGNLYTGFIGVIPVPIMYSIYLGFGLLILCIFIKIWL